MEESERLKLEQAVKELESYRGRHTELITIYVPAGYNLSLIAKQVESEKSTAANIKSKTTRKAVLEALDKISRHLKLYKATPTNGLAIFCGNISRVEGQEQIELWAIEPPLKLKTKLYQCDQTFMLEPLKEMLEAREVYGLLVIEREQALLGLLEGKNISIIRKLTSGIPGKTQKGGQSAARYARIREAAAKEFYRRVAEAMKQTFFSMPRLRGLLIGGPGPTKEDFLKEGQLITALREKILAVKDIGYADEHGLKLLVEASSDVLAKEAIIKEKIVLERFFTLLAKTPEKAVYGLEETKKALKAGAVDELLISTRLEKEERTELEQAAKNIAATIHIISEETEEGRQFESLGGVGAILRFAIK